MGQYVLRRIFSLLAIMITAIAVVFFALSLVPGDPARLILGQDVTPENLEELRIELGLNQPLWKQYLNFMNELLHGDLGMSYQRGIPVVERLASAYPITLIISTLAITISVIVGVGIGILAALKANTWVDHGLRIILLTSTSIPIFFLALLLIYLFSVRLGMLPSFGWGTPRHAVLPVIVLAIYPLAAIGRITRSSMLDTLNQDYVRTAQSKGLSEWNIIFRHTLKNASIGIITVIGLQFGILLAGAVLTESVLSIPGMGSLLINAIFARDYAVIRGVVIVGVVTIVLLNFMTDMFYLFIDPRIQYSSDA